MPKSCQTHLELIWWLITFRALAGDDELLFLPSLLMGVLFFACKLLGNLGDRVVGGSLFFMFIEPNELFALGLPTIGAGR